MVRGNHEDCARAGEGWIRFLDRSPASAICRDLTGIFVARLGDFGIVVVDGARAEDPKGDAGALAGLLRGQLAEVTANVPAEAWFVSHRPLNSMRSAPDRPVNQVDNAVQELAFGTIMPPGVRMTVAGHIHFFQAVDFGGSRPPQLVVGTGRCNFLMVPPLSGVGADIHGRQGGTAVAYSGLCCFGWGL